MKQHVEMELHTAVNAFAVGHTDEDMANIVSAFQKRLTEEYQLKHIPSVLIDTYADQINQSDSSDYEEEHGFLLKVGFDVPVSFEGCRDYESGEKWLEFSVPGKDEWEAVLSQMADDIVSGVMKIDISEVSTGIDDNRTDSYETLEEKGYKESHNILDIDR